MFRLHSCTTLSSTSFYPLQAQAAPLNERGVSSSGFYYMFTSVCIVCCYHNCITNMVRAIWNYRSARTVVERLARHERSVYAVIVSCHVTVRTSRILCHCCGGANGRDSHRLLFLMYGDFNMARNSYLPEVLQRRNLQIL